jgi:F420 biosynthesis protein FbiB-like protein
MSSNLLQIIKDRRSVKEYLPRKVSKEILFRILEAGKWAPSAHNAQPWRFIVIRDSAIKQKLAKDMACRWNEDMSKNGLPGKQRESIMKVSTERFGNASVIIVACLTMEDMDEYKDERRKKIEYVMAVQSVAAAIENILLAAHCEGLGACWFCAPLFCPDIVRKTLKIPEHLDPQALITLGYPARKPNSPLRKSLDDIVHQEWWEDPI